MHNKARAHSRNTHAFLLGINEQQLQGFQVKRVLHTLNATDISFIIDQPSL
jgi:hypothetical protein